MRKNSYDAATDTVMVFDDRARAIKHTHKHYAALFNYTDQYAELREQYAIANDAIPSPENRELMPAFFFRRLRRPPNVRMTRSPIRATGPTSPGRQHPDCRHGHVVYRDIIRLLAPSAVCAGMMFRRIVNRMRRLCRTATRCWGSSRRLPSERH
ncbi:MAG: hypothetical protein U5O39_16080 [Gammaproteobacteria bacterium]|nr:hypothetical protein [Gammaproteobacteria bacterium]